MKLEKKGIEKINRIYLKSQKKLLVLKIDKVVNQSHCIRWPSISLFCADNFRNCVTIFLYYIYCAHTHTLLDYDYWFAIQS